MTWRTLIAAVALGSTGCVFAAPRYVGPVSDHFDGSMFFSPGGSTISRGVGDFLAWQFNRKPGPWGPWRNEPPGPPPPWRVGAGELRVTFINHATVLLQLDGVNVLTDPIYAERASPVPIIGPRRVRPPGIRFEDLPAIDAVVISHNHYDHLNLETLRRLQAVYPRMAIFAGLGNKALLEQAGLQHVTELDWWQHAPLSDQVLLTSVPTQHFSNRGLTDSDATLWTGYVLESPAGRTYFAGDTGYGPHFKTVGDKLGPFRLAVLPIGAYLPAWMSPVHMSPADAVAAKADLKAAVAVGVHYGTFPLADDGQTQAIDDLRSCLGKDRTDFWTLGFGEGRQVEQ